MEKIFQALRFSLFIFAFIFVIGLVSGIQAFEHNKSAFLCHEVRIDGGLPSTGTRCNITSSFSSNGSVLINFKAMDNLRDRFCYNLTGYDTSIKGYYDYSVTCVDGFQNETLDSQYLVNLGGIEPSESRTSSVTRFILIFFALATLCFISLFLVRSLPIKASLFLFMVWFILMGINFTYLSIQDEILNTRIETFFSFFLTISFYLNYAIIAFIFILWIITFFVSIIERKKAKKAVSYGY